MSFGALRENAALLNPEGCYSSHYECKSDNDGTLSGRKVQSMSFEGMGRYFAAVVEVAVVAALVAASILVTVGAAVVIMGDWGTAAICLGSLALAGIAYHHFGKS